MSEAADQRLPLTVLSGFLGSGKTTLLNRLLAGGDGRRIMVLVNDFGAIDIDAELIAERGAGMIALSNGCVCCAIGGDLFAAFARALDVRPRPDHLVIEASGVADPGRIADFARAEPDMRLDQIVVLVDAVNFEAHYNDPLLRDTLATQIAGAHTLVLGKTDLADPGRLPALAGMLRRENREAPIVHAGKDDDVSALLTAPLTGGSDDGASAAIAGSGPRHRDLFESWSFRSDHPASEPVIGRVLEALPNPVLRLKGVSYRAGDESFLAFHVAGLHRESDWAPAPAGMVPGLRAVAIAVKGTCDFTRIDRLFTQASPQSPETPPKPDFKGAHECDPA